VESSYDEIRLYDGFEVSVDVVHIPIDSTTGEQVATSDQIAFSYATNSDDTPSAKTSLPIAFSLARNESPVTLYWDTGELESNTGDQADLDGTYVFTVHASHLMSKSGRRELWAKQSFAITLGSGAFDNSLVPSPTHSSSVSSTPLSNHSQLLTSQLPGFSGTLTTDPAPIAGSISLTRHTTRSERHFA